MDDQQKSRLQRYLMNAAEFMWGVHPGNQKEQYKWLDGKKIDGKKILYSKGAYGVVYKQLLLDPGIEELIQYVIEPEVRRTFPNETLDFLRKRWQSGRQPSLDEITNLKPPPPQEISEEASERVKTRYNEARLEWSRYWRPFLIANLQFKYIERWGELAGVWFEEIEPWLEEEGDKLKATP